MAAIRAKYVSRDLSELESARASIHSYVNAKKGVYDEEAEERRELIQKETWKNQAKDPTDDVLKEILSEIKTPAGRAAIMPPAAPAAIAAAPAPAPAPATGTIAGGPIGTLARPAAAVSVSIPKNKNGEQARTRTKAGKLTVGSDSYKLSSKMLWFLDPGLRPLTRGGVDVPLPERLKHLRRLLEKSGLTDFSKDDKANLATVILAAGGEYQKILGGVPTHALGVLSPGDVAAAGGAAPASGAAGGSGDTTGSGLKRKRKPPKPGPGRGRSKQMDSVVRAMKDQLDQIVSYVSMGGAGMRTRHDGHELARRLHAMRKLPRREYAEVLRRLDSA